MDVGKLLTLAAQLNVPGLVTQGLAFLAEVKANADRVRDALDEGTLAELEMIHAEALAAADALDAKLSAAALRPSSRCGQ